MTLRPLQPVNDRGQLRIGELGRMAGATEQLDRVSGVGGVLGSRSAAGVGWVLDRPRKFWARVLSGTNPYLCDEVYDAGNGSFPLAPDGLRGVTAWERNRSTTIAAGTVVKLTPDPTTTAFDFGYCCVPPPSPGPYCFGQALVYPLYAHVRNATGLAACLGDLDFPMTPGAFDWSLGAQPLACYSNVNTEPVVDPACLAQLDDGLGLRIFGVYLFQGAGVGLLSATIAIGNITPGGVSDFWTQAPSSTSAAPFQLVYLGAHMGAGALGDFDVIIDQHPTYP